MKFLGGGQDSGPRAAAWPARCAWAMRVAGVQRPPLPRPLSLKQLPASRKVEGGGAQTELKSGEEQRMSTHPPPGAIKTQRGSARPSLPRSHHDDTRALFPCRHGCAPSGDLLRSACSAFQGPSAAPLPAACTAHGRCGRYSWGDDEADAGSQQGRDCRRRPFDLNRCQCRNDDALGEVSAGQGGNRKSDGGRVSPRTRSCAPGRSRRCGILGGLAALAPQGTKLAGVPCS